MVADLREFSRQRRTRRARHHRPRSWPAGRRRRCRRPPRLGEGHRGGHGGAGRTADRQARRREWAAGRPGLTRRRRRLAGRRRPRVPVRQGARPVRPDRRRPGRARDGCCWWRRTSSRSNANSARRPDRLPALGVPAREHPPAAVHRRTLAARLLPVAGRRTSPTRPTPTRPTCCAGPSTRSWPRVAAAGPGRDGRAAELDRGHAVAGAARRLRPADGPDDVARGARRLT